MDCGARVGSHPGWRPTRDLRTVARCASRSRRAFTLVEFLVVISIVALLTAILMPSLARTREAADRLRCASNMRQVGGAIVGFLDDHNDRLPALTSVMTATPRYSEGMALTNGEGSEIDGLGHLLPCAVNGGYLGDARLLYCPCHHGDHPYQRYASQIGGRMLDTEPGTAAYCNYQYRGPIDPTSGDQLRGPLLANKVLVADGLRSRADFNHIHGSNRLFGDGHVDWRADNANEIYKGLPTAAGLVDAPNKYKLLWSLIDGDGMTR